MAELAKCPTRKVLRTLWPQLATGGSSQRAAALVTHCTQTDHCEGVPWRSSDQHRAPEHVQVGGHSIAALQLPGALVRAEAR